MWLWPNVLGDCKIWWRNDIRGALYKKKQSLCWKHVNSNLGAEHHLYFVLYGDHLMFFGDQTLQAPRTFGQVHIHEVSEFFEFFFYFFRISVHCVGAPKLGAATTFPWKFISAEDPYYHWGKERPLCTIVRLFIKDGPALNIRNKSQQRRWGAPAWNFDIVKPP